MTDAAYQAAVKRILNPGADESESTERMGRICLLLEARIVATEERLADVERRLLLCMTALSQMGKE